MRPVEGMSNDDARARSSREVYNVLAMSQLQRLAIEQAMQIATDYHLAGQAAEAEHIYHQVLAAQPAHADALHQLGLLRLQAGLLDQATELIQRAILANPHNAHFHSNLGQVLASRGQPEAAEQACRRALAIRPGFPEALNNLGNALAASGRAAEAISILRQVISERPDSAGAWTDFGSALHKNGQLSEAIAAYERALKLQPSLPQAQNNLGDALRQDGQLDQAIGVLSRTVEQYPNYASAHMNLGYALLQNGNLTDGWREHEWRLQTREFGLPDELRRCPQPMWDGSDVSGKRILLHVEQGLGDSIQFARYVPILAARGARVVLRCRRPLLRLFRRLEGVEEVVPLGDPLPPFDVHLPLLSLPALLGTDRIERIPANVPYLTPDPSDTQHWRDRLRSVNGGLKVGLVWAGAAKHANDRNRSIPVQNLSALAQIDGATLISLQKLSLPYDPPTQMNLIDWTSELNDFADTAALVANLDLLICVDTAVAHLSGAIGQRTWMLVPFVADWRWLRDRNDSPWYPTVRLFRQPAKGDWQSPIARVAEELRSQIG
jgi:Flp pilus assembly protein TadD